MHTGLIPLIPVLSRDAPEMEPGCLSKVSPYGCTASTGSQAVCSLPQFLKKTAPHYVGSCTDTRSLFSPTHILQEGRGSPMMSSSLEPSGDSRAAK